MSAPYCTSLPDPPTLDSQGVLHWSNGGWRCDSGPIEHYISHLFMDDGTELLGAAPQFRYDGLRPLDEATVPGLDRWSYQLGTNRIGQMATLDLYAITHSVYAGAYDWWEVGNHMAADPTQAARIRFQVTGPSPTPPPSQLNLPAILADVQGAYDVTIGSYPYRVGWRAARQTASLLADALAYLRGEK